MWWDLIRRRDASEKENHKEKESWIITNAKGLT
jgi:hypothetical protein